MEALQAIFPMLIIVALAASVVSWRVFAIERRVKRLKEAL